MKSGQKNLFLFLSFSPSLFFLSATLTRASKGNQVNIPEPANHGILSGNTNEPRQAGTDPGKSSLFLLTTIHLKKPPKKKKTPKPKKPKNEEEEKKKPKQKRKTQTTTTSNKQKGNRNKKLWFLLFLFSSFFFLSFFCVCVFCVFCVLFFFSEGIFLMTLESGYLEKRSDALKEHLPLSEMSGVSVTVLENRGE